MHRQCVDIWLREGASPCLRGRGDSFSWMLKLNTANSGWLVRRAALGAGLVLFGALACMSARALADDARSARDGVELGEVPLRLDVYTRQVQLGGLQWVFHPGFALGAEYPALRAGVFRFFPTWQLGFEHQASLHQRMFLGVAPSMRVSVHSLLAFQVSLGMNALYVRSLWTPYHFERASGTWSRGESESKWSWMFSIDAGVWLDVDPRLSLGIHYGFGAIYPFASDNDVPALPLTRLGISGRWIFGT